MGLNLDEERKPFMFPCMALKTTLKGILEPKE